MTEFPLGRSLGELQQFANDYFLFQDGRVPTAAVPKRWFCILGDPALRYPPMSPVRRFAGTRVGSDISLNWDPASATTARYFVFRSSTTILGPYSLLSDTHGLTSAVFLDSGASGTPVHYQLRSSELAVSGSGTFWNPSQSGTVTALYGKGYFDKVPFFGNEAVLGLRSNSGVYFIHIAQTGLIAADAKSMWYDCVNGPWQVTVDGVKLDLYDPHRMTKPDTEFREIGVDVSEWAGKEVELRLTPIPGFMFNALDNIRF